MRTALSLFLRDLENRALFALVAKLRRDGYHFFSLVLRRGVSAA